ncbi:hypothetical protein [Photobacterium sp. 1_MG-2023]|uniref:hypothetical protein n=1 Tax=Photobacterium sp. 1_MG-2023 TaxID=3062646 RepID=UPI0026E20C3B|nr:hypothetical protein [Photobacterium sp. 1_MG-2023]MDO6707524.1 hypothetical protein [Photobacterium sp. 1_MG-2023]
MDNWIKQSYQQPGPLAEVQKTKYYSDEPRVILDFTIFPGVYISDDLGITDDFETLPAMVRMTDEEDWEYEFIQAEAVPMVLGAIQSGEQIWLAYDDEALYFHPDLAQKIQQANSHIRMHRKL